MKSVSSAGPELLIKKTSGRGGKASWFAGFRQQMGFVVHGSEDADIIIVIIVVIIVIRRG